MLTIDRMAALMTPFKKQLLNSWLDDHVPNWKTLYFII